VARFSAMSQRCASDCVTFDRSGRVYCRFITAGESKPSSHDGAGNDAEFDRPAAVTADVVMVTTSH